MGDAPDQAAAKTATPRAPVTIERPVPTKLDFDRPYMARALEAVDAEHPEGTPGYNNDGYTVLQLHVHYFDRNNDGIIYPWETYAGLRRVGFNVILSFISALLINLALSYATLPYWIPNPLFPIYVSKIHKAKHGSDTGVYDTEGRFVPNKFEELWTKFPKTHQNKLTFKELMGMTAALRVALDPFGWIANKFEWSLTYLLAKDEDGLVSKEKVRGVFDGSLFYQVEIARTNKAFSERQGKLKK
ncbi:hypothetical protein R1sor_008687 [Riccia sorocarpa]|uniref:Caleosin n=1 Tax=Riccia sorocarpa TaxID=122646 RepID=A0ABD3HY92_9MARC